MTEIVEQQLSEHEARRLTERIRLTAHNYTEAKEKLIRYVQEAKDGNAHVALGYPSWTAYLAETLGEEPMRLARDERQEMVKVLSAEGMSTRAIAPVVGANYATVSRDLKSGVANAAPEPKSDAELVAGAEWSPEAVEDEPRFTDDHGRVQPVTGTITGMDGKQYTRPEPQEPPKQRRNPLPEQFFKATYDLQKNIERMERLIEDDRFQQNKEQIALRHKNDLLRSAELLQELLHELD